jgi:predicted transposase YbfD/YdcC
LQVAEFAKLREKWLKRYLPLRHGIPHRLTIQRVLSLLDAKRFEEMFNSIMQEISIATKGKVVSLDGKKYHTKQMADGSCRALYIVSAWCENNRLILGQVKTSEKSNEIPAVRELLRFLKIPKAIVTLDAMGCQTETVKAIVKENKADYVIALKGNQDTLQKEMSEYALDCLNDPLLKDKYETISMVEKGHGRIEHRTYHLFTDLAWYEDLKRWQGLKGLVCVESSRQVGSKEATLERRFYITSLTDINQAADAIRKHWGIENNLHGTLDVVLGEDRWATRNELAAANLGILRKLALTFLRKARWPDDNPLSGPMKMWACALNPSVLDFVFSQAFTDFS